MLEKSNPEAQKQASIKEFSTVLNRVPLNIEYSVSDLEFEFALAWQDLKPLLDKNCAYETTGDKIKIISKEPPEPDEPDRGEEVWGRDFTELQKIFTKTRKYRSIKIEKFKPTEEELRLLGLGVKWGIVFEHDGLIKMHKYTRPLPNRYKNKIDEQTTRKPE